MSIFDNDLLKTFADILEKKAQVAKPVSTDPIVPNSSYDTMSVARKFTAQLMEQYKLPSAPKRYEYKSEALSGKSRAKDLTTKDLKNLGDLLNYLFDNEIKWSGDRLVIPSDTSQPLPPGYGRFDEVQSSGGIVNYFVHMNALKQYLTYLRGKAHDSNNPVMQLMIGTLIDDANKKTSGEPLKKKGPADDSVTSTVDATLHEDTLMDILDVEYQGLSDDVKDGEFQARLLLADNKNINPNFKLLYFKNIKSLSDLLMWTEANKIYLISPSNILKRGASNEETCSLLQNLYKRASSWLRRAPQLPLPEKENLIKFVQQYQNSISSMASEVKFKDGSSCSVSSTVTTPKSDKDKSGAGGVITDTGSGGTGAGQGSGQGPTSAYEKAVEAALPEFLSIYPLDYHVIDIRTIQTFLALYNRTFGPSQELSRVESRLKAVKEYFPDMGSINISNTAQQLNELSRSQNSIQKTVRYFPGEAQALVQLVYNLISDLAKGAAPNRTFKAAPIIRQKLVEYAKNQYNRLSSNLDDLATLKASINITNFV